MTKFNSRPRVTAPTGPIAVSGDQPTINHEGGRAFGRDDKSDLFLLATTSIDLTAKSFYEGADARVKRFVALARAVAASDPDWMYRFVTWLRTKGNMRTAALIAGVEAGYAMTKSGIPGGRHLVATALRRADEPGEAIAYAQQTHGRSLPMPIKRGIGDAAQRLYNEWAVLKYDTASHGVRFADVLALTHPKPAASKPWQGELFRYAVDRRYNRGAAEGARGLDVVRRNTILREAWAAGNVDLDNLAVRLDEAGMTWEDTLSALGSKVNKADLWRALIPNLSLMAAMRNLRNLDDAGLSDADVAPVIARLTDPDEVAKSKQLPLRFLSAYRAVGHNLRWAYPLEVALGLSLSNVPALPGRTLILVDTSQSMNSEMSDRSGLKRWDAAVAFGLALASRCENVDVVSFANAYYTGPGWKTFPTRKGESLLKAIDRWKADGYFLNAGTNTVGALKANYSGHDRVIILTDEQNQRSYRDAYTIEPGNVTDQMPTNRPLITINLAGYESSHAATDRNRITIGGLTDAMFGLIANTGQARPGAWPWTGDPDIPGLPTYDKPKAAKTVKTVAADLGPRTGDTQVLTDFAAAVGGIALDHTDGIVTVGEVAEVFPTRGRGWVSLQLAHAASGAQPLPGLYIRRVGQGHEGRYSVAPARTAEAQPETARSTVPEGSQGGRWRVSDGGWTGRTTGRD
jgi:hypothetical protein